MNGITVQDVSKYYGEVCALRHVSLELERNKIYGLLGRNGAGKSTLLNIISNRVFSSQGTVLVDGRPAQENDKAQQLLYLMSEKTYYPDNMKVSEIFRWSKLFYPGFDQTYAERIAEAFGLDCRKTVKSFSTGYTSIFKLVIALSVNTPYVFLDEPVLGLDANHRELFYRLLLEKYSENPFTIVISTHLIEEVSNVIEEVIILKKAEVICQESRDSLLSRGYTISGPAALVDRYVQEKQVIGADVLGGLKTAYLLGVQENTPLPAGLEAAPMDLQKLFIQLTNA